MGVNKALITKQSNELYSWRNCSRQRYNSIESHSYHIPIIFDWVQWAEWDKVAR